MAETAETIAEECKEADSCFHQENDNGNGNKHVENDDIENDDDNHSDNDEYPEYFQSIRSPTGLEVGLQVTWPGVRPLTLSTTLEAEEMAPLFHGTQWAGTRVWSAAVVALQYLLLHHVDKGETSTIPNDVSFVVGPDTSVLELGCGLGVPGVVLHELVQCPVVLTDKGALLEQLRRNLADNQMSHNIQAHALDWSAKGVQRLLELTGSQAFDICLNCDCVYEPLYGREAWQALVVCQKALLQANPQCLLVTSLERRKADGVEHYLEALRQIAEHVTQIDTLSVLEHDPKVEVYVAYGQRQGNAQPQEG